jgi:ankyrin repeat protein
MGCSGSKGLFDVGYSWWYLYDKENWEGVERLVTHKPETCQQLQPDTASLLLHRLCERAGVPTTLIRKVVDAYEGALYVPDAVGRFPLHIACQRPAPAEVIEMLATPKSCEAPDRQGSLPLHMLCERLTSSNAVSLQTLDVVVRAYEAATWVPMGGGAQGGAAGSASNPLLAAAKYPFHSAMECGASDAMLELLLAGTAYTPPNGFASCLHWACSTGKPTTFLRKVMEVVPQSSTAKDERGNSALMCVLMKGDATPMDVNILVEAAPRTLREWNLEGLTPLHCAIESLDANLEEVVRILMEYDTGNFAIGHKDTFGRLPITLACKHKHPSEEVIDALLEVGGLESLQQADGDGSVVLHHVAGAGDAMPMSIIRKILELSPNATSIENKRGCKYP